jgi:hypothetical protein
MVSLCVCVCVCVCVYVCVCVKSISLIWGRDYAIQYVNYINNELLGKTLDTKFIC